MPAKKIEKKLELLEKILKEANYVLRLEKGNFNSGYCLLEHRKVVVLNKFLDREGRADVLAGLIPNLKIDQERLGSESKPFYKKLMAEVQLERDIIQQITEESKPDSSGD